MDDSFKANTTNDHFKVIMRDRPDQKFPVDKTDWAVLSNGDLYFCERGNETNIIARVVAGEWTAVIDSRWLV